MSSDIVDTIHHDGWAEVVLNRPERRNAITGPLSDALCATITRLGQDDRVAAIVLRGAGGSFCSGVDLTALQSDPPPAWADTSFASWLAAHVALFEFPKPIIGALERFAINGGAALALACDLLVAGETAFLQVGEIQLGARIPINAAWMRLRTSVSVANRVALLGDRVPGPELHRLGIAHEVVADDAVVHRACEIAQRIAAFPAGSPAAIKSDLTAVRGVGSAHDFFRNTPSPALRQAQQMK